MCVCVLFVLFVFVCFFVFIVRMYACHVLYQRLLDLTWLTRVVPDKGPLNVCVCMRTRVRVCVRACVVILELFVDGCCVFACVCA